MRTQLFSLKCGLLLSFFSISMLLNCLTTIILKFSVDRDFLQLGSLQLYKDIPIVIFGALLGSYIPRFGYLRSLIWSLIAGAILCMITPAAPSLFFFKIWFLFVGIVFILLKIAVYYITVSLSNKEKENSRLMQFVEASFMAGVIAVNLLFGFLLNEHRENLWKWGFVVMAMVCLLAAGFLSYGIPAWTEPLKAKENEVGIKNILRFRPDKGSVIFLTIIFLILVTEQSFVVWFPAFSKITFHLNPFWASATIVIFALSSFLGRILCGFLTRHYRWSRLFLTISFILFGMILSITGILWFSKTPATWVAFLAPAIGLAIGPLYPLINAHHLFKIKEEDKNALLAYLMIFTSLGSSTGALAIGYSFENFGVKGTYLILIPVVLVLILLSYLYIYIKEKA